MSAIIFLFLGLIATKFSPPCDCIGDRGSLKGAPDRARISHRSRGSSAYTRPNVMRGRCRQRLRAPNGYQQGSEEGARGAPKREDPKCIPKIGSEICYWGSPSLYSSGPEIGFPGQISAGISSGKYQFRPSDSEAFPSRIRPKSDPGARFSPRKHCCVT